MLNSFFSLFQIAVDDSMSVLALLAMGIALGVMAVSAHHAHRAFDTWRRWVYIIGGLLGLYTAVSYTIVLFIEPLANVAWLRPGLMLWMLHYLGVATVVNAVVTTSPSEQVRAENKRLEEKITSAETMVNTWQGIVAGHKAREAKLEAEKEEMTADTKVIVESLAQARGKLVEMLDKQMELVTENDRLKDKLKGWE
jgi:uncharacterized membrane protein